VEVSVVETLKLVVTVDLVEEQEVILVAVEERRAPDTRGEIVLMSTMVRVRAEAERVKLGTIVIREVPKEEVTEAME
jgi:hypothetical protein